MISSFSLFSSDQVPSDPDEKAALKSSLASELAKSLNITASRVSILKLEEGSIVITAAIEAEEGQAETLASDLRRNVKAGAMDVRGKLWKNKAV